MLTFFACGKKKYLLTKCHRLKTSLLHSLPFDLQQISLSTYEIHNLALLGRLTPLSSMNFSSGGGGVLGKYGGKRFNSYELCLEAKFA